MTSNLDDRIRLQEAILKNYFHHPVTIWVPPPLAAEKSGQLDPYSEGWRLSTTPVQAWLTKVELNLGL
jgi:hypothetical protein